MKESNERPMTDEELKADKAKEEAKAKAEKEAKEKADYEARAKADADAKAEVEAKAKAKPALSIAEQIKAAVSPKVYEQVQGILTKIKPESSQTEKEKALQQLGGFYSGKLLIEIKKNVLKK